MNEDLKRWDEEAENWVEKILPKRRIASALILPELSRILGNVSGKKILDAGCGGGFVSAFLKNNGATMVGIDGSHRMLDYAKQTYPEIDFRMADLLERLEFPDSEFDAVVSSCVLMSLSNIETFLSESARILKPGGKLIVAVFHPAFNTPTMKLYKSFWAKIFRKPVSGLAFDYYQKTSKRKDAQGSKPWPFYHRTIQEYTRLFLKYFKLEEITEPNELPGEFLAQYPKLEYTTRLPRFIFFKLVKV
ncbi:MAG: class I SAM-dependent methyltransferase [Candidatus Doudnabacteria bacterium]|nr:class I SAM-dependent methyltransferase [Candidatus Doudnabacteria bacterium]